MKKIIMIILVMICINTYSQDTISINVDWEDHIENIENKDYLNEVIFNNHHINPENKVLLQIAFCRRYWGTLQPLTIEWFNEIYYLYEEFDFSD